MKRCLLLVGIIVMSLFINVVHAEDKVYISKVELVEKSDDVLINKEPEINGFKIDFDVKFKNVRDFVKYKVTIVNNDSEDYTLSTSDKLDDSYIKYDYSYENDNKVIAANKEKILFVTITYAKEVPDDLYKNGAYSETHSTNLAFFNNRLPEEEAKEISNPKTNTASIVFIVLVILLSFIISFILSSRKMRRYLGMFIIILSIISPFIIFAINTLYITINTKVEIDKSEETTPVKHEYCIFVVGAKGFEYEEYEPGETWGEYFERTQRSQFTYSDVHYADKQYVSCYAELFANNMVNSEECEYIFNEHKTDITADDLIKDKEEGCYEEFGR